MRISPAEAMPTFHPLRAASPRAPTFVLLLTRCCLAGLAWMALTLLSACHQDASPPATVAPIPSSSSPSSAGSTAEAGSARSITDPVVLADGSLLRFRSTADQRLDHTPLEYAETLRVLVNYNRTDFFVNEGEARGFEYEYLREFERFLNQRLQRTANPIRLEFVVTDLDSTLPDLIDGRGDVAAANLTITPLRDATAAFSLPYLVDVDELVVTNRRVTAPKSLDSLAGKRVLVPRGSSYAEHLRALARAQRDSGKQPVEVIEAEPDLESEDILELVNAGIVDYTVVDSHRARLWAQVLPDITVHDKPVVNADGSIAWATRPASRELREALDAFVRQDGARSAMNRMLLDRYYRDTRWIVNPSTRPLLRRQAAVIDFIKRYSADAGLDWQIVLAQAMAASALDPERRGPNGAVGIMQVTPQMAAEVGVTDIHRPQRNIEAGVRYLARLRDQYAREAGVNQDASIGLALAAYRVGPEQLQALQRYARELGLNPAKWKRNLELVSDLTLGDAPGHQVNDVYLYLEAFRLDQQRGSRARR